MTEWASTPQKLPPKHHQRIIEQLALVIDDPSSKLRFINQVFSKYSSIPSLFNLYQPLADSALHNIILEEAEQICPGSRDKALEMMRLGEIIPPAPWLWGLYRRRAIILPIVILLVMSGVCAAAIGISSVKEDMAVKVFEVNARQSDNQEEEIQGISEAPEPSVLVAVPEEVAIPTIDNQKHTAVTAPVEKGSGIEKTPESKPEEVLANREETFDKIKKENIEYLPYVTEPIWLVEETPDSEVYSNGLRITTSYTVDNVPRCYSRIDREIEQAPLNVETVDKICGIVYHASESDIVDFRPEKNQSIIEYTGRLLAYIPREKCYHYFIDRFGRVYRVVREDHAAFHAGNSVWADEEHTYINLNHAFLGICFEGRDFEEVDRTAQGRKGSGNGVQLVAMNASTINDAQLRSGKELTDYLRFKYKIPEYNCVTHGLTSVSPTTMLIGYHLDLSHSFPFEEFNISNKYNVPLPSITDFGFMYDDYFVQVFDGKLWNGIIYSEELIKKEAQNAALSVEEYRQILNEKYTSLYLLEKRTAEDTCNPETLVAGTYQ